MKNRKFLLMVNRAFVIFLILVQIIVFIYLIYSSSRFSVWVAYGLRLLSFAVVLHIISLREKSGFKLIWVLLVLVAPVFGGVTYIFFHIQSIGGRKSLIESEYDSRSNFLLLDSSQKSCYAKCQNEVAEFSTNVSYLQKTVKFPVFDKTQSEYLPIGQVYFARLLEELEKAQKYIFIEYFIIDDGVMWNAILKILKQKVQEGVDVRLMYDDVGSFLLRSNKFVDEMKSYGIKCAIFNKFKPLFLVSQNNRDHRKIVSVDGKVAFTGGINIADEYINEKERFGYWKDCGVVVIGEAAWSFTVLFLQLWDYTTKVSEDFAFLYPWKTEKCTIASDGYVQPYAGNPVDKENISEHVYLKIISDAKNYLYIESPYFVIDDIFVSALILAAKSGVDVRIILPYKWDKPFIHRISKTYYGELIAGGVRVYEYLPGFIHSKVFLADDKIATVGTVNMDYRSLYHHFECGTCLYKTSSIKQIRDDFAIVLQDCHELSVEDCHENVFQLLFSRIIRIIAPLL